MDKAQTLTLIQLTTSDRLTEYERGALVLALRETINYHAELARLKAVLVPKKSCIPSTVSTFQN